MDLKNFPYPVCQIGRNRSGTHSLHQFFLKNGYQSSHYYGRIGRWPRFSWEQPLRFHSDYIHSWDIEEFMDRILKEHPNTKFIYNSRNHLDWMFSIAGLFQPIRKKRAGIQNHIRVFRQQFEFLIDFYKSNNSRFLLFDLNNDHIDKVIGFLPELHLDNKHWGQHAANPNNKTDKQWVKTIALKEIRPTDPLDDPMLAKFQQLAIGFDLPGWEELCLSRH